ncbi:MAG: hypothetical protein ACYS1A_13960 [Planctomycetota bacterium]
MTKTCIFVSKRTTYDEKSQLSLKNDDFCIKKMCIFAFILLLWPRVLEKLEGNGGRWLDVNLDNLREPLAQLLRDTAPADTQSTTVQLRSAGTASPLLKAYWGRLALEQNSALKIFRFCSVLDMNSDLPMIV